MQWWCKSCCCPYRCPGMLLRTETFPAGHSTGVGIKCLRNVHQYRFWMLHLGQSVSSWNVKNEVLFRSTCISVMLVLSEKNLFWIRTFLYMVVWQCSNALFHKQCWDGCCFEKPLRLFLRIVSDWMRIVCLTALHLYTESLCSQMLQTSAVENINLNLFVSWLWGEKRGQKSRVCSM